MYLIIFDNKAFVEDRTYYYCGGEHFSYIKSVFPKISSLSKDEIDGVLIYSGSKENESKSAIEVDIKKINISEDFFRLDYEKKIDIDISCAVIKKRLYASILKSGLIKKQDKMPFVLLFDINDYNNIINGKHEISTFSVELSKLIAQRKWEEVISAFGDLEKIEESNYWNDESALSNLEFALARVVNNDYKSISINKKKYYLPFFFKVNKHCMELEPNDLKHKSLLAFYYYNKVIDDKFFNQEAFNKAEELYKILVNESLHPFKEKYRFAKLKETKFDKKLIIGTNYYKEIDNLMNEYEEIAKSYDDLSIQDKINEKNNYCKCLFSFCLLGLNKLDLWKEYININVYKNPINDFIFNKFRMDLIMKIENYLDKIMDLQNYNNDEIEDSKPEYMFVLYRKAELEQIKGLIYALKEGITDNAKKFFQESNSCIEKVFKFFYKQKVKKSYPYYVNPIKAINYYFLGEFDKIDKCFERPKPYMHYVWGIINYLIGKKDIALKNIININEKDKANYSNAIKLKELISAEI